MEKLDDVKGESYVVDPKAVTKDELEWTDGVFAEIIREVYNNARGEKDNRHWSEDEGTRSRR